MGYAKLPADKINLRHSFAALFSVIKQLPALQQALNADWVRGSIKVADNELCS